jgi:hypothetical protein
VDVQYTPSATEALIPAAEVHSTDTILTQHGCAHDARLDSDIEIGLVEDLDGMLGQDTSNGDEFGVSGAIQSPIRLVHASTNDFAVLHKDTADGCLIALECKFGLRKMSQHWCLKWE